MPVTIGSLENTFANPIGLLSDCHRRIERFLGALSAVAAQANGGPLSPEQRHALEAALDYFQNAAPKHQADEEQDLFPTLRKLGGSRIAELMAQVGRLEQDHGTAAGWHREVDRLGRLWLLDSALDGADAARLNELLASLGDLYRAHIAVEERDVFPLAQQELSDAAKQTIGHRMASRRGVPFIQDSSVELDKGRE